MSSNADLESDRRPNSAPPILPSSQAPQTSKARKSLDHALSWQSNRISNDNNAYSQNDYTRTTTRNALGIISQGAIDEHLEHACQRKLGRDQSSGFRTPFGQDYKAVGGNVSIVPGDIIRTALLPEGFIARLKRPAATKLPLNLEVTVEASSDSFKFTYYEIDLTERPLHINPARTLHIQWSATEPRDAEVMVTWHLRSSR